MIDTTHSESSSSAVAHYEQLTLPMAEADAPDRLSQPTVVMLASSAMAGSISRHPSRFRPEVPVVQPLEAPAAAHAEVLPELPPTDRQTDSPKLWIGKHRRIAAVTNLRRLREEQEQRNNRDYV